MSEAITPVNITGAAIIAQLSIIVIMSLSAVLLVWGDKYTPTGYSPGAAPFILIILILTIVTLGCLAFSDEFSRIWKPLFTGTIPPAVSWSTALLVMFTMDIVCVTIMIACSGGSQLSAFTPIYFTLPALAIFLREPLSRIIFYIILTSLGFTYQLVFHNTVTEQVGGRTRSLAYWLVAISCFCLATLIGYITRPQY